MRVRWVMKGEEICGVFKGVLSLQQFPPKNSLYEMMGSTVDAV